MTKLVDRAGREYSTFEEWRAQAEKRRLERAADPTTRPDLKRDPTKLDAQPMVRQRTSGKSDLRTIHAIACGPFPEPVERAIREYIDGWMRQLRGEE